MSDSAAGYPLIPKRTRSPMEMARIKSFREFFMGLKRGLALGRCGSCETFYLMAKLCRDEGEQWLSDEEFHDVEAWIEAGTVLDLDVGCDDACALIRLYSRMSR